MKGYSWVVAALIVILTLAWRPVSAWARSAYSLNKQGVELYRQGKYKQALEKFIAAQVEDPENAQISYNLGNAYYRLQDYENAALSYRQSALHGKDKRLAAKAYYNLGNALVRRHKLQEAIRAYKKSLELEPKDMDAKKNLEFVQKLLRRQQQQLKQQSSPNRQEQEQKKQQAKAETAQEKKELKQKSSPQQEQAQGQVEPKGDRKEDGEKSGQGEIRRAKEENKKQKKEKSASRALGQMSDEEARRWLDSLRENQRRFIRRQLLRQQGEKQALEKDW